MIDVCRAIFFIPNNTTFSYQKMCIHNNDKIDMYICMLIFEYIMMYVFAYIILK